jgi:hypothetical protein
MAMRQYLVVLGIFPQETAWHLRMDRTVHIKVAEVPEPIEVRVQVRRGKINALVAANADLDPQTVVNVLRSDLATVIDTLAYRDGCGWHIEVLALKGVHPPVDFVWTGYVDELRADDRESTATEEQAYFAINVSSRVSDALADLRRAMREPWDSASYCQRAIEMARRYWEDSLGLSEKDAWTAMRRDLNVSENAIRIVTPAGNRQRHGHRFSVTSVEQGANLVVASSVITRLIFFLAAPDELSELTRLDIPKP